MSQEPKVTRFGALPTVDAELATKAYVDAGGGGTGQTFAKVVKSIDETLNSDDTLQDDDELVFAANANKTYYVMCHVWLNSGTTPDFKFTWVLPAGASGVKQNANWNGVQDSQTTDVEATNNVTMAVGTRIISMSFKIIVGGTAGDIQLQWAQQTSDAGDTTVQQGSCLLAWEET